MCSHNNLTSEDATLSVTLKMHKGKKMLVVRGAEKAKPLDLRTSIRPVGGQAEHKQGPSFLASEMWRCFAEIT